MSNNNDNEDAVCGYEKTTTGKPCQHPAGSCPVDSHTQGRPTKYTKETRETLLESAREGLTIQGCARSAGIGESTLYDWLKELSEFSESFNRARAHGEKRLVQEVSERDPKFILERSYDYTKKTELEHSGEVSGFEFTINYDDD